MVNNYCAPNTDYFLDRRKVKLCGYNCVEYLCNFLKAEPHRYSDLKYWCLMLIHQFCLTEAVINYLIDQKVVFLLVDVIRLNYGNPSLLKLCFHSMVRILSCLEDEFAAKILHELADMKVISLASASLRSNDSELCQWTLFLLHEFVIRKVELQQIIKVKGLLKIMLPFLDNVETIIPRIILRTMKTLCEKETTFYKDVVKAKAIEKILKCATGSDEQTQYWSLALLHTISYQMGSHKPIFECGGIQVLLKLADSNLIHVKMYVIEILSVLCSDPSNSNEFETFSGPILQKILHYLGESELELRHSTLTLLINFFAMSRDVCKQFSQLNGMLVLSKLFLGSESPESIRPIACKAIVTLAKQDEAIHTDILVNIIVPGLYLLIKDVMDAIETDSIEKEKGRKSKYLKFSASNSNGPTTKEKPALSPTAPTKMNFPKLNPSEASKTLLRLASTLECLSILFSDVIIDTLSSDESGLIAYLSDLIEDVGVAVLNSLLFPLCESEATDAELDLSSMKKEIALHGVYFIQAIVRLGNADCT